MTPEIGPRDLHLVLDAQSRSGKLFITGGELLLAFEARNKTVLDNGNYGTWSPCPPGEFLLGAPIPKNTPPFGPWFLALLDYGPNTAMADHGRSGIGVHGGGSGLTHPLAPQQSPPWTVTHGCWRVVNAMLDRLVHEVKVAQGVGGRVYCTVVAPRPGSAMDDPNDWADVPFDQIPEEE